MSTAENRELQRQYDALTSKINDLTKLYRGKIIRAGASGCIEEDIAGVPKRQDIFISFFTEQDIPTEFRKFIEDYSQRLIGERLLIWQQIEKVKVEV